MSAPSDAAASPDAQPTTDTQLSVQEKIHLWSKRLPPWQSDLLRRLSKGPLSRNDEDEVLRILLETNDAPTPQPLKRADLPEERAETDPVELREIRDVQNVNLLAENQTLRFKPGINVIFGTTGTGKSGYGRLLRRLCLPSESTEVLPNAYDVGADGKRQTATVEIAVGDERREIAVDLAEEADPALSTMSTFLAARAPTYVAKPCVIERIPEPLLLLRRLAEAQEALQARLKEQIAVLRAELPDPKGTPVSMAAQLGTAITAETDVAELERHVTLNDHERAELKRLEAALATLGSDDSHGWEKAARAQARAATKVADELERAAEQLSDKQLTAIADSRARLDEAIDAERSLADDTFSNLAYPGTGSTPWRAMWEAARHFVETEGGAFPCTDQDTACPLCQETLTVKSSARMSSFEEFVRGDLRKKVNALSEEVSRAVGELPDIASIRAMADALLAGAPEDVVRAATETTDTVAARAELAAQFATSSAAELGTLPKALWSTMRIRAYADEQLAAAETQSGLRDEATQQSLVDRCAELRARKELAAALPEISEQVARLAKIDRYEEAVAELWTMKVSIQLRKLQRRALTESLLTAIDAELTALDLLTAEIMVMGRARAGRTALEFALQGAGTAKVEAILSDGEQRAAALALFLAERSVDPSRSAIILDDPAALLDRKRCEHVARRLVEEAERRQVIVLTHDLSFLQMLQRAAAAAGQGLHSEALRRAGGRAGVLGELPASSDATAVS